MGCEGLKEKAKGGKKKIEKKEKVVKNIDDIDVDKALMVHVSNEPFKDSY